MDTKELEEQLEGPRTGRRTVFPMGRLKLAKETDSEGRYHFKGYASVFGNRDAYGDIVVRGAFERTLKDRPDVKVLWQHFTDKPIGRQVKGYEDEYGLAVEGALTPTDFVKGEVVPLLKDGVVNGLSIGYDVVDGKASPDGFLLTDVDLWEWSPVTFPANELAVVTEAKSLDDESRLDRHVETVERHAKTLAHELDGFFKDSDRRDGLQSPSLTRLTSLLTADAGEGGPEAADARDARDEFMYLSGLQDGLQVASKRS